MQILEAYTPEHAYVQHAYPMPRHLKGIARFWIEVKTVDSSAMSYKYRVASEVTRDSFNKSYSRILFAAGVDEAKKLEPSKYDWSKKTASKYTDFMVIYLENDIVKSASINFSDMPTQWEVFKEKYYELMPAEVQKKYRISEQLAREQNAKAWLDFDDMTRQIG